LVDHIEHENKEITWHIC